VLAKLITSISLNLPGKWLIIDANEALAQPIDASNQLRRETLDVSLDVLLVLSLRRIPGRPDPAKVRNRGTSAPLSLFTGRLPLSPIDKLVAQ
jgi:hypothetical protein